MALLPIEKDTFVDEETFKESVSLSTAEAIKIQKNLINSWEPVREVWSLKYGGYTMAAVSSIGSLMINGLFKRKLKLRYPGEVVTTVAIMLGPAVLTQFFYETIITERVMLYKKQCPICYDLKAGLLLNANAILYPLILSPTISLAVAGQKGLRVPYFTEGREIAKFWWSVVKPAINHLTILFCINTLIAGVVVHKQFEAADRMAYIIQKIKKYAESH